LRQGANLPLAGKVIASFHKGTDFCPCGLTLSGHVNTESHGNTYTSVGRAIVAGIAVAVDIGGIGRVTTPSRSQPPVGAGTPITDN